MSLILDALRKSDRQRARQIADRLREGPPVARRRSVSAFLVIAMSAVLLTAVTAWHHWRVPATAPAVGEDAQIMENEPRVSAAVRDLAAEWERPIEQHAPLAPPSPTPAADESVLTAPLLATLPAATRARLPQLELNVHAWAEDPAARFVLINLRRYGEGDRLQEGPLVRRIVREGVILEFEGTLFTLPRL